jgi:hypothetical protein
MTEDEYERGPVHQLLQMPERWRRVDNGVELHV